MSPARPPSAPRAEMRWRRSPRARPTPASWLGRRSARRAARRERAEVVDDVPRLLRGDRLTVRGHDRAADDDVAVPAAVGALPLQIGVGEIGGRNELRRDGPRDAALAFGPVARRAERPESPATDPQRFGPG